MELHFYNGIFIFALFIVSGKQTAFYKLEDAIWILLNQGIQSEQYIAWISFKSRFFFFLEKQNGESTDCHF